MGDDLRDALGVVDLRHPFGERAEHLAIIDLLERVAPGILMRDLADEQQQRRAVLHRDMHADRAMAGTGAARDHRRRRPTGQLAVGLGHVHRARLEPAGDQLQLLAHIVQPVEHVEETISPGTREHVVDALRHQRIRQNTSAHTRRDAGLAGLSQLHPCLPGDNVAR